MRASRDPALRPDDGQYGSRWYAAREDDVALGCAPEAMPFARRDDDVVAALPPTRS